MPKGFKKEQFDGFDEVADRFLRKPSQTNRMPAMCQLMLDGKYIGFWSLERKVLPTEFMDKLGALADYRLTYPRWLFLRDFPESQFNPLRRSKGDGRPRKNFTPFKVLGPRNRPRHAA